MHQATSNVSPPHHGQLAPAISPGSWAAPKALVNSFHWGATAPGPYLTNDIPAPRPCGWGIPAPRPCMAGHPCPKTLYGLGHPCPTFLWQSRLMRHCKPLEKRLCIQWITHSIKQSDPLYWLIFSLLVSSFLHFFNYIYWNNSQSPNINIPWIGTQLPYYVCESES